MFQKVITITGDHDGPEPRAIVVTVNDRVSLIGIEITEGGPTPQSEILNHEEARALADALNLAADRADILLQKAGH